MKAVLFCLLATYGSFVWAVGAKPVDANAIKMNPYGKYLEDKDEVSVEIGVIEGENADGLQDVLMKITGGPAHSEGIDGKTLYYTAEPAGTGYNLVYSKDGNQKVRMISRDSWGSWKNIEIYVNGKKFNIYANADKAKTVQPLHLLTDYKQNVKK